MEDCRKPLLAQSDRLVHCFLMRLPGSAVPLLACPYDRARLETTSGALVCSNPGCRRRFPVIEGVPVLINSDRSLFSIEDYTCGRTTTVQTHSSWKQKIWRRLNRFVPSLSHNPKAAGNFARFRDAILEHTSRPVILIVGAGELGDGLDEIITDGRFTFVECDVYINERVHAIADGHDLPFLDGSFDGVICQAVLEHVVDPQRCVDEIHRVLNPRGVVYAEIPFMQQVHMQGYDFTRFTLSGCRRLFRNFTEISAGALGGPGMALAWSISYFVGSFSQSEIWSTFRIAGLPFFIFWIKYFDVFLNNPKAADAASASYFLGYRSETPTLDREILRMHWTYHRQ
jgi:SAM-dependent methyltransferase